MGAEIDDESEVVGGSVRKKSAVLSVLSEKNEPVVRTKPIVGGWWNVVKDFY